MKYNMVDIYQEQIEEIDKQLKAAIFQKKWNKVNQISEEKKNHHKRLVNWRRNYE